MPKIIVITGAGSGLGRALARRLAGDGDTVILLGRTLTKLEAIASEIGERAIAISCDVSQPDSIRDAFAQIKARVSRIDALINNAALVEHGLLADVADRHVVETIATNLVGPILCAKAAIPLLGWGGHILNVSSGAAERNFPALTVYATSKADLERFSLALQEELQPLGIKVTFLRAGQMVDDLDRWALDPTLARMADAAAAHGIDPRKRPSSTFASVADLVRVLIDLPADLSAAGILLRPHPISRAE